MLRSCVSYIFCSTLPSVSVFLLIPPNASFLQSMASSQYLFPPLLHPHKLVPAKFVLRPLAIQSIMPLYTLHSHLCHLLNTLVPKSHLPHLQFQISSFVVPKPQLHSNSSNHSFAILSFPPSISFAHILPLFNLFSYTEWSHKLFHPHKFPKLILSITKHFAISFISKAPITTGFYNLLMLAAEHFLPPTGVAPLEPTGQN